MNVPIAMCKAAIVNSICKRRKSPKLLQIRYGTISAKDFLIMNKAFGVTLLVVGVVLIVYGINASNSVSSNVAQTFTGAPTNKTLLLLIGGIAAAIVGAALTFSGFGKVQKK